MQLRIRGFRTAQAHPRRDVFDRQCGFAAQPGRNLELDGIISYAGWLSPFGANRGV
jgi:hypothetical protein